MTDRNNRFPPYSTKSGKGRTTTTIHFPATMPPRPALLTDADPSRLPWTPQRPWVEAPGGPQPAGDVGGDGQVSEAWGRRFTARRGDGMFAVVDDTFYVEVDPNVTGAEPQVTRQVGLTVCTDSNDPGGTEVWGGYLYRKVSVDDAEITEEVARACCAAALPPGKAAGHPVYKLIASWPCDHAVPATKAVASHFRPGDVWVETGPCAHCGETVHRVQSKALREDPHPDAYNPWRPMCEQIDDQPTTRPIDRDA